jgi:adenylate kinase
MNLIFLGPPGAGKGTLAERAEAIFQIPQISTGAIFRSAIAAKSELGLKVKSIIETGKLVDDALTSALVKERLAAPDAQKGFILDGFPRTIAQADMLETFSKIDKVVNFDVSDEVVHRRLGGRRICPSCGEIYHVETLKPKQEGVCDKCGSALIIRNDDRPETIKKRLEVYRTETEPLIDYYRKKALLVDIDARPDIAIMVENFKKALPRS